MSNKELNTALYEKLYDEQKAYRDWVLSLPPEEILNNAYECLVREDIVLTMEFHDLTDEQATALIQSPAPLDDIFHCFEKLDSNHMENVLSSIEKQANDIIEKEAIRRNALVYTASASYAKNHNEYDLYLSSYETNIACRNAIEDAIAENYRDSRFNSASAVKSVVERFGLDRTKFVMAATIQDKDWDGRISAENKQWAKTIEIPQDDTAWGTKRYRHYVVYFSHSGLIDLFANRLRKELELHKNTESKMKNKEIER